MIRQGGETRYAVAKRGPIKAQTLTTIRERGVPVATVLDVGVLYGTPELIVAYPDMPHILFEPVVEFREEIAKTYRDVKHTLIAAAVSETSGEVSLQLSTIIPGLPISHSWMVDGAGARTVPMVSLDDYLRNHPSESPYLLKIDIDGHEMRVLRGASETLAQTSIVMVETSIDGLTERIRYLEDRGFQIFDLTEPCYYDSAMWICDAVMIRRELRAKHFADINKNFDISKWEIFTGDRHS